jgi:hypothetical protein
MWWLVVPLGGLAVAALLSSAEKEHIEARNRWQRKRTELGQAIDSHRESIERKISSYQPAVDFHHLTGLHFSSARVADEAYQLLRDAGVSLDAINGLLLQSRHKKNSLESELRSISSPHLRREIVQEINQMRAFRDGLFKDQEQVKMERNALKEKLRFLNSQTHSLKVSIRDKCGTVGRDWYSRLEARAAARRKH